MSDTTTRGVRVEVESRFEPGRSSPAEGEYFFSYTVRISNVGQQVVQLLNRHWVITNANGEVEHVRGPGVVGEQPVLAPGQAFEYTSYCPLPTAVGTMHGEYEMRTVSGAPVTGALAEAPVTDTGLFEALIAPFSLAVPHALN